MVIAAIIAAVFAVGQIFLDTLVFTPLFSQKPIKALLPLVAKMLCYGLGFWILFAFFRGYVVPAAIGFGIGFFPSLFVYAFLKLGKKTRGGE